MIEHVSAVVLRSTTAPDVYRGACLICGWATDPGGTAEAPAQAAATAHVESVHGGRFVRSERRIA